MTYLVYQREKGESGTEHFQGYVELAKQTRFNAIKKKYPKWHIEPRRGTQEQAIAYCKKDDSRMDGPYEFGEPKQQGQRTDIAALVDLAKSGKRKRDALEEMPGVYARNYRAFEHIQSLMKPPRRERRVVLLHGPPGSGKTRYVLDKHPDAYVIPITSSTIWFDGYDGHDVALIDDFNGQIPLIQFLRVLHEYPEQVPVKGGHVWWNPSIIYITSNYAPVLWYKWEGREVSFEALTRRITEQILFPLE